MKLVTLMHLLGCSDPKGFLKDCLWKGKAMIALFAMERRARKSIEKKIAKEIYGEVKK